MNAIPSATRPLPSHSPFANIFWSALLIIAALLIGLFWRTTFATKSGLDPSAQPRAVVTTGNRTAEERENIHIYEAVSPSVAQVTSLAEASDDNGLNVQEVPEGVGSGFVWDTEGHIVTNFHVVDNADGAQVTLADHSTYAAQSVWADPDHDIAVLWIKAPKDRLHPVTVGTSHDLKVGQIVYALGDPFGLALTMTTGIVSALGREIHAKNGREIHGVIQISAPINPGNSGGPLLDSAGRLIGMNTAIVSPSGAFAGIGFAIPVDEVNQYVPELIRHGKIVRPRLGVQVAEDQLAQQMGVEKGVLILKVLPDSAAEAAHLQSTRRGSNGEIQLGDVILAIDGNEINSAEDLNNVLEKHHIGDTVQLNILRDGKEQNVAVTLRASK